MRIISHFYRNLVANSLTLKNFNGIFEEKHSSLVIDVGLVLRINSSNPHGSYCMMLFCLSDQALLTLKSGYLNLLPWWCQNSLCHQPM